ncbi:MAG TPA: hypothetical protein VIX83_03535 [Candidatus Cybelea sp.]
MNTSSFTRYAGAVGALAICSACSGGSSGAPANGVLNSDFIGRTASMNAGLSTAARSNASALQRYQTLVPNQAAKSKSKDFEYVISYHGSFAPAGIFNYPKSNSQIGTISEVSGQGARTSSTATARRSSGSLRPSIR